MKGTKYLSELVDRSALQKGQLNVIKAPTGSGKTYFALNYIPSLTNDALHNVVYLIDTINGKEQIARNYNATSEYYGWSKEVESGGMWFEPDNRVVVITYAKFGVLFERNIEFYKNFSYIICDEIHSLLRFQNYSKKPNYERRYDEPLQITRDDTQSLLVSTERAIRTGELVGATRGDIFPHSGAGRRGRPPDRLYKRGEDQVRIDADSKRKKKKKRDQSVMEAEMFRFIEKTM